MTGLTVFLGFTKVIIVSIFGGIIILLTKDTIDHESRGE